MPGQRLGIARRLIEPLGFVPEVLSIPAGLALPFRGGPAGFTLAKLIDADGDRTVPVRDVPADWLETLKPILHRPPPWAGLTLDQPAIMAILNVTPDSFSDGGRYGDASDAIRAGLKMARSGAAIIDVGGESTRPGAAFTSPEVEQSRVLPVVRALAEAGLLVSVDTRNAATMELALQAGAGIVNDVSGLGHDPRSAGVVARHGAHVVLMHMRGDPGSMNSLAVYGDVTIDVVTELAIRVEAARNSGIETQRIVIDPGIGFAKTVSHNIELLKRLPLLCNISCPILVGASRKSFIGRISAVDQAVDRVSGSVFTALHAVSRGASILRVHDIDETVQAVRMRRALAEC